MNKNNKIVYISRAFVPSSKKVNTVLQTSLHYAFNKKDLQNLDISKFNP